MLPDSGIKDVNVDLLIVPICTDRLNHHLGAMHLVLLAMPRQSVSTSHAHVHTSGAATRATVIWKRVQGASLLGAVGCASPPPHHHSNNVCGRMIAHQTRARFIPSRTEQHGQRPCQTVQHSKLALGANPTHSCHRSAANESGWLEWRMYIHVVQLQTKTIRQQGMTPSKSTACMGNTSHD